MAELRPLLIGFLIIGLFAVAIINVGYYIQTDNDATETIADSQYGLDVFKQNITSKIDSSYDTSNAAENSTSSSSVTFNYGSPFLDAINGIWKTIKTAPVGVYELTIGLANDKFFHGTDGLIITTTIAAILTITIIFAVWKMIATGDAG